MADGLECLTMAATAPEHPKIMRAGGDAGWLWFCALAYCKRLKTDGVIEAVALPRISDRRQPMKLVAKLVQERLMHGPGHDCTECAQPMPGSYVVHDYVDWQGTAAEAEEAAVEAQQVASAKGRGGAFGNHRRWHAARGHVDPDCRFCIASSSDMRSDNRSESDAISDGVTESGASRVRVAPAMTDPPSPPIPPPPSRVDIPPPTPPARRRKRRYNYDADLDFLRFWEVFPVKKGKPEAYDAWLAAKARGADPEVIITAAKRYADDPKRKPDHTKYPQGWLNGERYNDEPGNGENSSERHFEF